MLYPGKIDNPKFLAGLIVVFLLNPLPAKAGPLKEVTKRIHLSGYYKNLLTISETSQKEDFTSDLNRLRLELDASINKNLNARIIYDNELIFGNVLKTDEFKALKNVRLDTFFDLDTLTLDRTDIFWRQSLYRIYVVYTRAFLTVTTGRQRIALGTGRLWNPEDLLNPASPLQVERDERTGTDAVNLDISLGAVSTLSMAYAPGRSTEKESFFIKGRSNLRGYDLSGMIGSFRDDTVLGLDFSGYIKDSGFRGEGTYTFADKRADFLRLVLSFDHTFPSSLYLLVEYLYNGGNTEEDTSLLDLSRFTGEIITRNKNFLGLVLGYDLTPLARIDLLTVLDLDDKSLFLSPALSYNILENLDLSIGVQLFSGKSSSEYGDLPELYYAELKWYF